MRTITPRALVLWALVALVGSCATSENGGGGGGGGGGGSTVTIGKASPSGDLQTATAAAAVASALRVIVTENGSAVSGRTVAWSTPDGGSVSATSATDASGIATTQWTLGQSAGSQTATATLSGANGSPVSFGATATAGPAATIAKTGGDSQSGVVTTMLANPLQATASDQFGNPVSGVGVMWQVTVGAGTVNPTSSNSSSAGQAETVVTLGGSAGAITIQAVSTGLTGSPLSYSATALTLPTMVTVEVVNSLFQPAHITIAAGGTVTWNWAATTTLSHNVSPDATEPVRNGNPAPGPQTYQFIFNTPGVYAYFCEVHGLPGGVGMAGTVTVM